MVGLMRCTLFVLLGVVFLLLKRGESFKLDCYPIDGVSKENCEALGCMWHPVFPTTSKDEKKSRVDEPWCYFPYNYKGYEVTEVEQFDYTRPENEGRALRLALRRTRKSALGDDIERVFVDLLLLNQGSLLRMRVFDADKERYEPQLPKLNFKLQVGSDQSTLRSRQKAANAEREHNVGEFLVTLSDGYAQVANELTIRRASNKALLFSTDFRRLIFAEKFIQLNSKLSTPSVYGLGEHFDNFHKTADEFKTYSFWNTDHLTTPDGQRSYGGFPFLINLDEPETPAGTSGGATGADESPSRRQAHGLYLHNSNAMDVVLQKDVSITFRPIGGILDFFLFIGPNPLDVVGQYQALVGLPELPPRWALGFHLCRYNYGSLERTRHVFERTREAGIPFDVQWNDIDYMENGNDFTVDPVHYAGLAEFVDELHEKYRMHYVPIFDPGLSQEANYYPYELGDKMQVWIRNASGQPLVGKVWNKSGRTVWPDFSKPATRVFWREMFIKFYQQIKFDGAWIDMNDISNFVDGSLDGCPRAVEGDQEANWASIESTPYKPGGYDLQHKTLCLSARHFNDQLEFNVHNLYAFYEAIATREALEAARPNKRSLIISRSSYSGQGRFGGHWSGDVLSDWDYLRWSIASLLEHSMYGYTMIGTDICGFGGNTTVELCARWSTLGAFYTFSRNHNDDVSIDQDPVALGDIVVAANKNAYTKKYSLLPYFYTQIFKAHLYGEPVARSLSFEFFEHNQQQNINELQQIESQFMIGPSLMVAPIVHANTHKVRCFLPKGRWYQTDILPADHPKHHVAKLIDSQGQWFDFDDIELDNLLLFLRGGSVLPVFTRVGPTTEHTVEGQPISLMVALSHNSASINETQNARGELIYDDGESTELKYNKIALHVSDVGRTLKLRMLKSDYEQETRFGQVIIFGLPDNREVDYVSFSNGTRLPFQTIRQDNNHMLKFDLAGTALTKNENLVVIWSLKSQ